MSGCCSALLSSVLMRWITASGVPAGAITPQTLASSTPGIPDSVKDKIFNPFFTLRKDGTGLGLAIVHKIIQDHGGVIDVADNQPKGARITFRLPGT